MITTLNIRERFNTFMISALSVLLVFQLSLNFPTTLFSGGDVAQEAINTDILDSQFEHNWLNHSEAKERQIAEYHLAKCQSGENECSADEITKLVNRIAQLNAEDERRDNALIEACAADRQSYECEQHLIEALVANGSLPAPFDPTTGIAYVDNNWRESEMYGAEDYINDPLRKEVYEGILAERDQTNNLLFGTFDATQEQRDAALYGLLAEIAGGVSVPRFRYPGFSNPLRDGNGKPISVNAKALGDGATKGGDRPDLDISQSDLINLQVTPPGQGTVVTVNGGMMYVTKNMDGEINSMGPISTEVGVPDNIFSTSPSSPPNWKEWFATGLGDGARLSDDFDFD